MTEPEQIFEKSGNPDLAFAQWKELQPLFPKSLLKLPGTSCLLTLLGNSRFLVEYLMKEPAALRDLASSTYVTKAKERNRMIMDLRILFTRNFTGSLSSAQKILRHYRYVETARIAIRDLTGLAPFETLGKERASLAATTTEFAKRAAFHLHAGRKDRLPPFAVLGLGKLGGDDLNFSSDIDILYVYDPGEDAVLRRQKGFFEFFSHVAEAITRILQERTEDGFAFRVDLNLRPEGKSGPLVNSLGALAEYYEISGAAWERAALIKARPVAGDPSLGERILRQIEPFVYRRSLDASVILELKKIKEKINAELKKTKSGGFHVKLGEGGIREIEFFCQAFQLVYGGKEPRLKERNTLKALEALKKLELVPAREIAGLREAYILLRRIENRLQMVDERQLHTLPHEKGELLALARRTGFSSGEQLLEDLDKKTKFVASCFERLAP